MATAPGLPSLAEILDSDDPSLYDVVTHGPGPQGRLPLTAEMLREQPSGPVFGMSQDAGMGWAVEKVAGPHYAMLSTLGGIRADDGSPIALGYHTGHWELGMALREAAGELRRLGGVPYAGHCTDPCDGRTQGTPGMFDSLAYRNDAAAIFSRLARSLPTARGVLGVATCDKGLPAMMMALAGLGDLPCVLVPGGVMLPSEQGEDTAKIQSVGAVCPRGTGPGRGRRAGLPSVCLGWRRLPFSWHGRHGAGGRRGARSGVAAFPLAPSGQAVWLDMARRSATALVALDARGMRTRDVLSEASIRNAMAVFAAVGGSTNLVIHLPAVAFSAGLRRPTLDDWTDVNRRVPRLVDVLPNGPANHPTIRAYLAGGVPEVMLRLRDLGLLELDAMTVTGQTLGQVLTWWEGSPRRKAMRQTLRRRDGIDPDDVILSPERAVRLGMTSTVCFPRGNLAPEGSVIKSTAIDPRVLAPMASTACRGPPASLSASPTRWPP